MPRTRSSHRSRRSAYAASTSAEARSHRVGKLAEIDLLERGAARHRVGLAGELRFESLARPQELEPVVVEGRRSGEHGVTEPVAIGVVVENGEPGLCRTQRHRLAVQLDSAREDRILERVEALRELGDQDAALAGLPQPKEPLVIDAVGLLGLLEESMLVAGEQVGVARDDRRLLARLLLTYAHGPGFL